VGPRASLDSGKSRPTGIRSLDRPARSQSLYRLSYLAHTVYTAKSILTCQNTFNYNLSLKSIVPNSYIQSKVLLRMDEFDARNM
jgi:hypothetical protein